MKQVALSEVKAGFSRYLRIAETEEVVITRNGKPAGVLFGFRDDEDWAEYRLHQDARFVSRMEHARNSMREGRGTLLEDLK